MGIPAPRFDYDAMATPGGIGQGLAGLGGALANAAARRRQAAVEEQRLAQQQQGMAQQQANSDRSFEEGQRQFNAGQELRQQEMGLRGLESFGRGAMNVGKGLAGLLPNRVDEARIRNLDADTARKQDPGRATPAKDPRIIPPAVWNQLDQAALEETDAEINRIKLSPEHAAAEKASRGDWNPFTSTPAAPDLNKRREELLRANRERRGLSAAQPWQAGPAAQAGQTPAPISAKASPAAAGTLRKRVAGAYGAQIPPDVLARLAEAEAGDEDAILDVEEALSGGVMVDPEEDPTTLLGQ